MIWVVALACLAVSDNNGQGRTASLKAARRDEMQNRARRLLAERKLNRMIHAAPPHRTDPEETTAALIQTAALLETFGTLDQTTYTKDEITERVNYVVNDKDKLQTEASTTILAEYSHVNEFIQNTIKPKVDAQEQFLDHIQSYMGSDLSAMKTTANSRYNSDKTEMQYWTGSGGVSGQADYELEQMGLDLTLWEMYWSSETSGFALLPEFWREWNRTIPEQVQDENEFFREADKDENDIKSRMASDQDKFNIVSTNRAVLFNDYVERDIGTVESALNSYEDTVTSDESTAYQWTQDVEAIQKHYDDALFGLISGEFKPQLTLDETTTTASEDPPDEPEDDSLASALNLARKLDQWFYDLGYTRTRSFERMLLNETDMSVPEAMLESQLESIEEASKEADELIGEKIQKGYDDLSDLDKYAGEQAGALSDAQKATLKVIRTEMQAAITAMTDGAEAKAIDDQKYQTLSRDLESTIAKLERFIAGKFDVFHSEFAKIMRTRVDRLVNTTSAEEKKQEDTYKLKLEEMWKLFAHEFAELKDGIQHKYVKSLDLRGTVGNEVGLVSSAQDLMLLMMKEAGTLRNQVEEGSRNARDIMEERRGLQNEADSKLALAFDKLEDKTRKQHLQLADENNKLQEELMKAVETRIPAVARQIRDLAAKSRQEYSLFQSSLKKPYANAFDTSNAVLFLNSRIDKFVGNLLDNVKHTDVQLGDIDTEAMSMNDQLAEQSRQTFRSAGGDFTDLARRADRAGQQSFGDFMIHAGQLTTKAQKGLESSEEDEARLDTRTAKQAARVLQLLSATGTTLSREETASEKRSYERFSTVKNRKQQIAAIMRDFLKDSKQAEHSYRLPAEEKLHDLDQTMASDAQDIAVKADRWAELIKAELANQQEMGEAKVKSGEKVVKEVNRVANQELEHAQQIAVGIEEKYQEDKIGKDMLARIVAAVKKFDGLRHRYYDAAGKYEEGSSKTSGDLLMMEDESQKKDDVLDRTTSKWLQDTATAAMNDLIAKVRTQYEISDNDEMEIRRRFQESVLEDKQVNSAMDSSRILLANRAHALTQLYGAATGAEKDALAAELGVVMQNALNAQRDRASENRATNKVGLLVGGEEATVKQEAREASALLHGMLADMQLDNEPDKRRFAELANAALLSRKAAEGQENHVSKIMQHATVELGYIARSTNAEVSTAQGQFQSESLAEIRAWEAAEQHQREVLQGIRGLRAMNGDVVDEVGEALVDDRQRLERKMIERGNEMERMLGFEEYGNEENAAKILEAVQNAQTETNRLSTVINSRIVPPILKWRDNVEAIFKSLGMELDLERVERLAQEGMDAERAAVQKVDDWEKSKSGNVMKQLAADTQRVEDMLASAIHSVHSDASLSSSEKRARVAELKRQAATAKEKLVAKTRAMFATQGEEVTDINKALIALDSLSQRAQLLADGHPALDHHLLLEMQASLRMKLDNLRRWVAQGDVTAPMSLAEVDDVGTRVARTLAKALAVRIAKAGILSTTQAPSRGGYLALVQGLRSADRARREQDRRLTDALELLPAVLTA